MSEMILGAKPYFGEKQKSDQILNGIRGILDSGMLTQGAYVKKFEECMVDLTGAKHALAISSGGAALELVLTSLDLNGREVIVPTDTFVATANAVIRAGGRPVFADIEEETLCLDPDDLPNRISSSTAGVIYVHMFGLIPPSFRSIRDFCDENGLFLVEDAAHAHGTKFNGESAGSLGTAACFSFYATKIATTGEGGMVTTDSEDIYKSIQSLRDHGKSADSTLFDKVSNNYRLPEISSLLGLEQLSILEENVNRRREIAEQYRSRLKKVNGVRLLRGFWDNNCSYWRFPLYLEGVVDRLELQKRMKENHKVRITWMYEPLCHMQPVFSEYVDKSTTLMVAEKSMSKLICLPCYPGLKDSDVDRICSGLEMEINNLNHS